MVDGDTFRYGAERVSLRGINTPELNEPDGQAAKLRLEELLRSGPVPIVPMDEMSTIASQPIFLWMGRMWRRCSK